MAEKTVQTTAAEEHGSAASHGSSLPPSPDFDAMGAAAHVNADRRLEISSLIGNLTISWANNESMLIYVLMLLLRTDSASAAIVFGTLNTTRARLDLVQRLAKAKISERGVALRLEKLIKSFEDGTKMRNEFNHSMYLIDENGSITHTHAMRIEERRGRLEFGRERALDKARLQQIRDMIHRMGALNREFWALLPEVEAHMAARP